MTAAIISHGSIVDFEFHIRLLQGCSLIVCADGGALYAKKMNIQPHAIIGDFDSCSREFADSFEGAEVIQYPSEKDKTDTQLAVEYVISKGEKNIMLLGATGTRIDHTMANLNLLLLIMKSGAKGEIINEYNRAFIIKDKIHIKDKGSMVSLIPYGGDVKGVTLKGFKYPLNEFTIKKGESIGVSNVLEQETGEICIQEGVLLIVQSTD